METIEDTDSDGDVRITKPKEAEELEKAIPTEGNSQIRYAD